MEKLSSRATQALSYICTTLPPSFLKRLLHMELPVEDIGVSTVKLLQFCGHLLQSPGKHKFPTNQCLR